LSLLHGQHTCCTGEQETKILPQRISGKEAFALFSTYGFPLELTLELAEEKNIAVDTDRFKEEMMNIRKK